jgi:predicted outer membrane repeat protein
MTGTLFVGAPSPTYANGGPKTYFVAQSGGAAQEETPARKGTSCADPDFVGGDHTPITAAVGLASDGDTIYICAGTYLIEATIGLGAELLTLQGAGAGVTILDGGGNTQILTSSSAITVSNLTFQNGRNGSFGGNGGAIYAPTVTVTSSTFIGNYANAGGAIAATTATITASTFTENDAAGNGAAIYATTATVTSSRFTGNITTYGGAISASTVTVTSSRFIGNIASSGGAIHADTTATVTRSTFTGNTATNRGGAIDATTGTIARSRFTRNTAGDRGGAVALWSPNSGDLQKLRRNTFTRNRAGTGAAVMLGSCGPAFSRSQAARVERANSFSGNRATAKRRTNNIERWTDACG